MPTDKLRPEEIDAAIAASQRQGRRHGLRLDPDDLTAIETSYRTRERRDANDPDFGLRDGLGGAAREPEAGEPGIPPYPERPGPEFVYAEREEDLSGGRRRRPWPMLVAGLALGAFAAIIWWAYGTEPPGESGPAPLITAEEGAVKVRPEDEGGLQVPFQDTLIYSRIEPDATNRDSVERLLPPPPAPVAPPEAPDAEAAPADEAGPPAAAAPTAADQASGSEEAGAPNPLAVPAMPVESVPVEEVPAEKKAPAGTAVAESDGTPPAPPSPPARQDAAATAAPNPAPAERPAAAEGAAPQLAQASGAFRIQLAAFRTADDAEAAWTALRGRHPELLEPLKLTIVRADLGDKGIFYRVQAGPLADRAAAQSLCSRLQERNQACLIVAP